jgi:glutathione S-transferase
MYYVPVLSLSQDEINYAVIPASTCGCGDTGVGGLALGCYEFGITHKECAMLTVHHLNDSRSQRILWLLEELGAPYEIAHYARDATTRLAPPELMAVHPLGKSPVITDGARTIIESGAIIDYIVRHYGNGALQPSVNTPAYDDYVQWLHYAEGSAMLPLMLKLYVGRLGDAGAPLHPRIESEIANHLGYVNNSLADKEYLVEHKFSAADVQMSFVGEVAGAFGKRADYPHIEAWIKSLQARPAYQAALARGGVYSYGK